MKFCPHCNYAISKVEYEQARFDFDCPNCGERKISEFYSPGSMTHKMQLLWQKEGRLPPLPTQGQITN